MNQSHHQSKHITSEQYEEEISIREIILSIVKHKILILIFTVVGGVLALLMNYMAATEPVYHHQILTAVSFPGIERHTNPDGSSFEAGQLITPFILEGVLKEMKEDDPDFPLTSLEGILTIEPFIPIEIQKEMDKAALAETTFAYFPSKFVLSIRSLVNLLTPKQASKIFKKILESYATSFETRYNRSSLIIPFSENFNKQISVGDLSLLLGSKTKLLLQMLEVRDKAYPSYVSKTSGMNYNLIKSDVQKSLKQIELISPEALSKFPVVRIPKEIAQEYDFFDVLDILDQKLIEVETLTRNRVSEDTFYKSSDPELSFRSLLYKIDLIGGISMVSTRSMVKIGVLSRDKKSFVRNHKDWIQSRDILRQKKESESKIAERLLKNAFGGRGGGNTSLEGVRGTSLPTSGGTNGSAANFSVDLLEFMEKNSKNEIQSKMLQRVFDAAVDAENYRIEIGEKQEEIKRVETSATYSQKEIELIVEKFTQLISKINGIIVSLNQLNDEVFEYRIKVIVEQFNAYLKSTNVLNEEIYQKSYSLPVKVLGTPSFYVQESKIIDRKILLFGAAALFLGIGLAFGIEAFKKEKS